MAIDANWQLLKAAESALRALEALVNVDWQDDVSGVISEAEASAEFLSDAIAATKSANMCQADEVPAAVVVDDLGKSICQCVGYHRCWRMLATTSESSEERSDDE